MELREPAIAFYKQRLTIEEYLEIENASDEKHEYYKGEVFLMAGTKQLHNIVTGNIYASLWNKLSGKSCRPYGSDARIHIEENTLFTYPDVSVFCGEPKSRNNDDMNFLNPTIIFEVLSPSTKAYDRGQKFELYKAIPTLQEYILVSPEEILIEAWRMTENGVWELKTITDRNDSLILTSVDTKLPLMDIYRDTPLVL